MLRSRFLPIALALLASPMAPIFAAPVPPFGHCLDRQLDVSGLDAKAAIGLSVAIVPMHAEWSWAAARGYADRDARQLLTTGHVFRIASNTKTYTAAGVLQLVEAGKLGLDDPVARHLPPSMVAALRSAGYDVRAIHIRHLLNHTAGLREHVDEAYLKQMDAHPERVWTVAEQVQLAMAAGSPLSAPGEAFHYSDTGYVLLGAIIERYSGKPLPVALRTMQRWDAHGLAHTWFESLEPARAPQAHQYWNGMDTRQWNPSFDLYGGGGIVATPTDMAVYLKVLLKGELFATPASLSFMRTPGLASSWNGYGAGLYRIDVDGEKLLGHAGFWNTFAFYSARDDVIYAGATGEKTVLPYAQLVRSLQSSYRHCRQPRTAPDLQQSMGTVVPAGDVEGRSR